MAGEKVYTGAMISALETKIDSMVTTLQEHTTALGNINTAVGQSVTAPNVVGSDVVKLTQGSEYSVAAATTNSVFKKLKMLGNGSMRFKGSVFITTGASVVRTLTLSYSKDGGTTWVAIGTFTCSAATGKLLGSIAAKDIDVSFNDSVWLGIKVDSATNVTAMGIQAASDLIGYTLKDVVNGNAFNELSL